MKKYFWIILCIIWILFVGNELKDELWHVDSEDDIYTTFNGDAYDSQNDIYYVTDNIDDSGFVYAIGSDYEVKALFNANGYARDTYCDDLFYKDGRLFVLIHGETKKDNFPINAYTFVELNPTTLQAVAHSNWFATYDNIQSIVLSSDDTHFYVTGITEDDMHAQVYAIPVENLVSISENDDTNMRNVSSIRYSTIVEPADGYHLVYAEFENGQLTTMENGNGVLNNEIYNLAAKERFENKTFTIRQLIEINRSSVIIASFIALAGILFILSMYFFVKKRNRVAYMIAIWEMMLAITLGYIALSLFNWSKVMDFGDVVNFTSYILQDVRDDLDELEIKYEDSENFYRTESYRIASDQLREVVEQYDDGNVFANTISVTLKDGKCHVIAAAKGLDNCDLNVLYGPKAVALVEKVHETGQKHRSDIVVDGVRYSLICVGSEQLNPTSMVLAVLNQSDLINGYSISVVLVFIVAIIIFILASIIGILVLLRQSKDLRLLGNTMLDVSQGGIGIAKPKTLGEDMSDMWSGLMDIDRSFKNLNYIKYRTFEAYYKFAPKSIEKVLDKTSITEVTNGDAVQKKGTIVLMSTDSNNMLLGLAKTKDISGHMVLDSRASEVMAAISRYQEENLMLKISCTSDFSELQLLMPESTMNATRIGTDFSNIYRGEGYGTCIFMHYTDYLYGVAIAGEEAVQFLLSSDIIRIRENIKLLNELRLAQVITKTVYDREEEKPNCRYIGYWELGSDEKLNLYEILDAYDNNTRRHREDTRELFEEGLNLFYDSNFYLARNNFAKVLKADYSDTVARWYLFASEKYLDGSSNKTNYSLSK